MVGRSLKALYWVTTDDHGEDWFVIAGSQEEAVRFHEQEEGYDPGDPYCPPPKKRPNESARGWSLRAR